MELIKSISLLFFTIAYLANAQDPLIQIPQGKILGSVGESIFTQKKFDSFLKIPYAKPPIGPLRFKAVEKADNWEGVLDGRNYSDMCPQIGETTNEPTGSEDCLYLNVFRPSENEGENSNFPVVVMIHGGSFMFESGEIYGPGYFLEHNVVYVTFNYRIGIFGFLNSGDGIVQGNMGLKDQTLALKWVQENIQYFGGDKERVTIFGHNSGAVSVHLHLMSPMSKGLFSRVVCQSGTALSPWSLISTQTAANRMKKYAKALECSTESTTTMLDCINEKEVTELTQYQDALQEWYIDPLVIFGPTIETAGSEEKFLPQSPYRMMKNGHLTTNIPILMGVNSDEGLLHSAEIIHNGILMRVLGLEWERAAPITLMYRETSAMMNDTSKAIREFYFGDHDGIMSKEVLEEMTSMYSDRYFFQPITISANSHLKFGVNAPFYLYLFDYEGKHSIVEKIKHVEGKYGVCHYDQIQYISDTPYFPLVEDDEEVKFAKAYMAQLVSFFQIGIIPDWKRVSKGEPLIYNKFASEEKVENPWKERMQFWDGLFLLENDRDMSMLGELAESLKEKDEL